MDREILIGNILEKWSDVEGVDQLAYDIHAAIPHVNWRPIAELPEELKDGETVILGWVGEPVKMQWADGWWSQDDIPQREIIPTYFSEINDPEKPTADH